MCSYYKYGNSVYFTFSLFFQDLVVIGGDLVDGPVYKLEKAVEPLEWINPTYGTYYVTGINIFKDELIVLEQIASLTPFSSFVGFNNFLIK